MPPAQQHRIASPHPRARAAMSLVALFATLAAAGCDRPAAPAASPPRPAQVVFQEWRAIRDADKRLPLAEEIVRDRHLVGLPPERVVQELGKPNPRRMSPEYGQIKYVVGPNAPDDLWLCIHVKDGSVTSAVIRSD